MIVMIVMTSNITPSKRANTATVEELEAREMFELSDSTSRVGDNAGWGANMSDLEVDFQDTLTEEDMTATPSHT